MNFRSTRGKANEVTALGAVESGLAPDGGLYVPLEFPKIQTENLNSNLSSVAEFLLPIFFSGEKIEPEISKIAKEAFNFPAPLTAIEKDLFMLELFHGPTAAFKDYGARFLAGLFRATKKNAIVLVATSGDTGGAVAAAFNEQPGIDVFVLFPQGGVSERQRHQLTCWGKNVHSFAVKGTFDDCQALVKKAFLEWKGKRPLTSANSISVGRLLPQTVYYASSSLEYFKKTKRPPHYIIPTGNLGNAVAGMWAKKIGFPIGKITLSCNANDILPKYFSTGEWQPKATQKTLANAMDVGNPSNMERLLDLFANPRDSTSMIDSHLVSDETIKKTIGDAFKKWGVVICPHTATAFDYVIKNKITDGIIVSTAHAAKFETIVEPIVGKKIKLPESLESIASKPETFKTIDTDFSVLMSELKKADR
jgi:threonine synthase